MCKDNADGSKTFYGNYSYTLEDAINPNKNEKVQKLYGSTGGF